MINENTNNFSHQNRKTFLFRTLKGLIFQFIFIKSFLFSIMITIHPVSFKSFIKHSLYTFFVFITYWVMFYLHKYFYYTKVFVIIILHVISICEEEVIDCKSKTWLQVNFIETRNLYQTELKLPLNLILPGFTYRICLRNHLSRFSFFFIV